MIQEFANEEQEEFDKREVLQLLVENICRISTIYLWQIHAQLGGNPPAIKSFVGALKFYFLSHAHSVCDIFVKSDGHNPNLRRLTFRR